MSKTQSSAPIHINNRTIEHQTNGYVNENNIKVREYINPAIYVETTYKMNSCNQTIYFPGSGDHPKTVTVKRCACFTNPDDCPCHPRPPKEEISQAEAEGYGIPPKIDEPLSLTKMKEMLKDVNDAHGESGIGSISQISSSNSAYKLNSQSIFESDSGITVKATNSTSDLRLSIPSLTSIDTIRVTDNHTRGENYREWCRRKDCERKLQEERDQLIQKIKEQQKQAVLELERENFKRWLTNKKKKDEEARQLKLQQQEEARRKEEEKNKRLSEKERNYQIWLRKKEKDDLEKNIKKQLTLIEREEEKQRRIEVSQQAYEYWREHSRNRQKPLPFGRGMDTLKSSVSVSYINPQPWVPNIEPSKKPHSQ